MDWRLESTRRKVANFNVTYSASWVHTSAESAFQICGFLFSTHLPLYLIPYRRRICCGIWVRRILRICKVFKINQSMYGVDLILKSEHVILINSPPRGIPQVLRICVCNDCDERIWIRLHYFPRNLFKIHELFIKLKIILSLLITKI